jgi:hypothetical protein
VPVHLGDHVDVIDQVDVVLRNTVRCRRLSRLPFRAGRREAAVGGARPGSPTSTSSPSRVTPQCDLLLRSRAASDELRLV